MKLGKSILVGIGVLLMTLSSAAADAATDPMHDQAVEALEHSKKSAQAKDFNFQDDAELQRATLGEGLDLWGLSPVLLSQGTNFEQAMVKLNEREYLVTGSGRAVTRLRVREAGARLGGSGAALEKALGQFPEASRPDVRLVQFLTAEFLYLGTPGTQLVVFTDDAEVPPGFEAYWAYPVHKVIPLFVATAKVVLEQPTNLKPEDIPLGGIPWTAAANPSKPPLWPLAAVSLVGIAAGGILLVRRLYRA